MKISVKWQKHFILAMFSACSLTAHGGENYGFSSSIFPCSLWSTFFPISFQVPSDDLTRNFVRPVYNIIYITDDKIKGMDDFYDLYNVKGKYVWPTTPTLTNGRKTPVCRKVGDCVIKGYGGVGSGVSAYYDIVSEFPSETVKVHSDSAYSDGSISWVFLPMRKLKLLRIEYFTPYTEDTYVPLPYRNSESKKYTEPLFFEYRATGNGDEMMLRESGGTTYGANFNNVKLPQYIRLTHLSAIQIWLNTKDSDGDPWRRIYPSTTTVNFTDSQSALIPANCQ